MTQKEFIKPLRCLRCGEVVGKWDDKIKNFVAEVHAVYLGHDDAFKNPSKAPLMPTRHRPVACCARCFPAFQQQVAAA